MTPPMTPAELYRHGLHLLLQKDISAWVDLWDDDGVLEFPFAPEGWPPRLEGKAAVAAYMRHYPDHIDLHDFPDVTIHQTTTPATIVVEMRGVGRLVETGSPFDLTYIAVVTVKDGLITSYRDYWNPLAVSRPGADFTGAHR
ncbi:nuclear transport factor 2 family protein [Kitasatospora sp. NBC_01250]|uniref:nuclear transport factor 2 family protein n=1 Tax=unclassified Kitasatospora TaxID=2633591 RepID=UPI002E152EE7|nr:MULTISPECIES: nuclear transport factor 2 family protein [unclassified Kitasatospora]WSJ64883.1 nuclear transport factor 2 family protein [Kitasatospora sp. NBC_01302]